MNRSVDTLHGQQAALAGDVLRDKLRAVRDQMPRAPGIRLHRAVSWLRCGEQYAESDEDLSFIALWIAFNSCCSVDDDRTDHNFREDFEMFAGKLVALDHEQRIYNCLWFNFSKFVRLLIDSRWVFAPFWQSQRDGNDSWKRPFTLSRKRAYQALADNEVPVLLSIIMDRLYVLRNQLVHGGATWQSELNRDQVRDGKRMLLELVPVFIEIMFDVSEDWGEIYFPVIDGA